MELASPSADLTALRRRMAAYQANGAALGWLLLPEQGAVEIWLQGEDTPQRIEAAIRLEAGARLPGLVLELEEIWRAGPWGQGLCVPLEG